MKLFLKFLVREFFSCIYRDWIGFTKIVKHELLLFYNYVWQCFSTFSYELVIWISEILCLCFYWNLLFPQDIRNYLHITQRSSTPCSLAESERNRKLLRNFRHATTLAYLHHFRSLQKFTSEMNARRALRFLHFCS